MDLKILKMDTLSLQNGGFWLERKLEFERNYFKGTLKSENDYGKSYEVPFAKAIQARKN